jgi:hypothetical protein
MKIRYNNLTQFQKNIICNGCGGKGSILKAPKWLFNASCNRHDFNYWIGCKESDRLKADRQFLKAMRIDISEMFFLLKLIRHLEAQLFYFFVRKFGKKFFYYGEKERNSNDLETFISQATL